MLIGVVIGACMVVSVVVIVFCRFIVVAVVGDWVVIWYGCCDVWRCCRCCIFDVVVGFDVVCVVVVVVGTVVVFVEAVGCYCICCCYCCRRYCWW